MRKHSTWMAVLAILVLVLAACTGGGTESEAPADSEAPAGSEAPADIQLSVVDPGLTEHAEVQQPSIDTAEL